MQKKILFRTNLFICMILAIGFISVSAVSYYTNIGTLKTNIRYVSELISKNIYYQMEEFFAAPVNVSLTMAYDNLLKQLLYGEGDPKNGLLYEEQMGEYLDCYKKQYDYDSVFLVSAQTGQSYRYNGRNHVLSEDNPEDQWYYRFLKSDEEYSLCLDGDEDADNAPTVFVNCKIKSGDQVLGVVGVGLRVRDLQKLLQGYDREYPVKVMLVDEQGVIRLSSKDAGEEGKMLFEDPSYAAVRDTVWGRDAAQHRCWLPDQSSGRFVCVLHVPTLGWNLVVENNTDGIQLQFFRQTMMGFFIMALIAVLVLYVINHVVLGCNDRLVKVTVSQELEYQRLLREAAEGLYEAVFELDITHGLAGGESTRRYFESLGMKADTPYQEALKVIAIKQIRQDYVDGYLTTFDQENVLSAYKNGIKELYYDFMITDDGEHYRWMRIRARIFYWASDQSVRMITYRQDVTDEKEHEVNMLRLAQSDPLTGLYNKVATEERIDEALRQSESTSCHALVMIDIDRFKEINDTYGHSVGDNVIKRFGQRIKQQFRASDICGRVGGDEFIVFLCGIPDRKWLASNLDQLSVCLHQEVSAGGKDYAVSASIGASVSPADGVDFVSLYRCADQALYESKKRGRDCFTIYQA